jgi:hypothetical protein
MVKAEQPAVKLDSLRVAFRDERAVANAELMLPASLAGRLGVEALVCAPEELPGARQRDSRQSCPDSAGVGGSQSEWHPGQCVSRPWLLDLRWVVLIRGAGLCGLCANRD